MHAIAFRCALRSAYEFHRYHTVQHTVQYSAHISGHSIAVDTADRVSDDQRPPHATRPHDRPPPHRRPELNTPAITHSPPIYCSPPTFSSCSLGARHSLIRCLCMHTREKNTNRLSCRGGQITTCSVCGVYLTICRVIKLSARMHRRVQCIRSSTQLNVRKSLTLATPTMTMPSSDKYFFVWFVLCTAEQLHTHTHNLRRPTC